MNNTISLQKTELRKSLRAKLKAMSHCELKAQSEAICQKLLAHPEFESAKNVAFFVPLKIEPDILPVIESALQSGKNCFVPRVIDEANMVFHKLKADCSLFEQLESGAFGILEPKTELPVASNEEMISGNLLVLVPALGFSKNDDGSFARLGKGKGYYDRFFAGLDSVAESCANQNCVQPFYKTLGIAFSLQLVDEIPTDKFDYSIDDVITD